jgi:riboflavin biosynthesis pyrimidine reductase
LPLSARVVQNITGQGDIIVYCSKAAGRRIVINDADKLRDVGAGVGLVDVGADGHLSLPQVLQDLGGGLHAMVEPGPTLARAFFTANLVDRVWVIRSPKTIAEPTAPSAASIPSHYVETGSIQLGRDTLTEYLNAQSPLFSAATPSADFVLTREKYNPGVTAY